MSSLGQSAPYLNKVTLEQDLQAWREAVQSDPMARFDESRDLAFWQEKAVGYDLSQPVLPKTLDFLAKQLQPYWSLLDVGAGTGRLSLPLAGLVKQVTALDYSPDMLAVLENKLCQPNAPKNIQTELLSFQHPQVPKHDVVLAAWALYRSLDLRADVLQLCSRAIKKLIIIDSDGESSPHEAWRREQQNKSPKHRRASLIAALLAKHGCVVQHQRIAEPRKWVFEDQDQLLEKYKVSQAKEDDWLGALKPYLAWENKQLVYRFNASISVVVSQPKII